MLNSVYGSIANPHSRWFDYDIAESITMTGQLCTKAVSKFINEKLKQKTNIDKEYVCYFDTDSTYVDISDLVDENSSKEDYYKIKDEIETIIEEACQYVYQQTNIYQPILHMKIECIGSGLWRKAKNYVMSIWYEEGIEYDTPKIKMQGIEAVKSSTPEICRDKIKESISLLVNNKQEELAKNVQEFREYFYNQPYHVVAKPSGVTDIDKYRFAEKSIPFHVRGSLVYNKLLDEKKLNKLYTKIRNGDKIRVCYLRTPNPINSNVIACPDELPEEFGLEQYIDYELQFKKCFLDPIKSLTDIAKMDISGRVSMESFYE